MNGDTFSSNTSLDDARVSGFITVPVKVVRFNEGDVFSMWGVHNNILFNNSEKLVGFVNVSAEEYSEKKKKEMVQVARVTLRSSSQWIFLGNLKITQRWKQCEFQLMSYHVMCMLSSSKGWKGSQRYQ